MTAKSIIDVEINTGDYDKFVDKFNKNREAIDAMPEAWKNIGQSIKDASDKFFLSPTTEKEMRKMSITFTKSGNEARDAAKDQAKYWKQLDKSSFHFAKNVIGATRSLLKWAGLTTLFSGLLGGGSLFSLDRLARSTSFSRSSAQGLGVTSSEEKAFGLNYSPYMNGASVLGNIADAKSNYANRWAFSAMGVSQTDVQKKDPAALAVEMAIKAKKIFDSSDQSEQSAKAHGLLQFYTMDELRRLHAASMKDLLKSQSDYSRDKVRLNVGDPIQQKWQQFGMQLSRAGSQIENVFVTGLLSLTGPLKHLSSAFADALSAFMASPQLKEWIVDLGHGIEHFSKYLLSPKFQSDAKSFADTIGSLADAVVSALKYLGLIADPKTGKTAREDNKDYYAPGGPADQKDGKGKKSSFWDHPLGVWGTSTKDPYDTPFNRKYLGYDSRHDITTSELHAAVQKEESGNNPDAISPKGAKGLMQVLDSTNYNPGFGVRPAADNSAAERARVGHDYLDAMIAYYKGNPKKALAAYNWGPGNVDKTLAKYGSGWGDHLPKETRDYIQDITGIINKDLIKHGSTWADQTPEKTQNVDKELAASALKLKHQTLQEVLGYMPGYLPKPAANSRAPQASTIKIELHNTTGNNPIITAHQLAY